ncbi:EF-hand domain pair [Desulfocurvibacter africanus PCS]|uniref:EF-hand domain pair n=1 Tax=Desulfocurvibacter africanus PCS TaxID=1262666 RepID=M5PT14_DESAF|nr:EF-hand domain-containing protein [Desulfocurvibacter africanus]EMG37195.1 EF-hand domain pair [Desulfocurvibacter africanus PCS]
MRKLTIIMASVAISLFGASLAFADIGPGVQQQEYSLFEQMDQNGDGIVSESEFQEYSLKEQDKTQLFAVIDQNGDGVISESEWIAYQEAEQPMATEEPMAVEEPVKEKRGSRADVWDEQVYDVNDPRKIEPKDKSMKGQSE